MAQTIERSIRAGDLRHVVSIQRKVETRSVDGGFVETWSRLFDVRAMIRPISGAEYLRADAVRAEVTHEVRIRQTQKPVTPTDRLKFNNRILNIVSILHGDEYTGLMTLMCKEAV